MLALALTLLAALSPAMWIAILVPIFIVVGVVVYMLMRKDLK